MAETNGRILRAWLLIALRELGGSGPRRVVHQAVQSLFGTEFTAEDLRNRQRGNRRDDEAAWRNNLDSLYDRLKKDGTLLSSVRGNPWRLAPAGVAEAASLPAIDEGGGLQADGRFNPKDSSPYMASVAAQVQVRLRDHEALLADYGNAMTADGWRPVTDVHPRDMEMTRAEATWLVEVKMIYRSRATAAVREALAQLLEYRYNHYTVENPPGLLAVFSQDPGPDHQGLLRSIGIVSVWRDGQGWGGCSMARGAGLIPRQA